MSEKKAKEERKAEQMQQQVIAKALAKLELTEKRRFEVLRDFLPMYRGLLPDIPLPSIAVLLQMRDDIAKVQTQFGGDFDAAIAGETIDDANDGSEEDGEGDGGDAESPAEDARGQG